MMKLNQKYSYILVLLCLGLAGNGIAGEQRFGETGALRTDTPGQADQQYSTSPDGNNLRVMATTDDESGVVLSLLEWDSTRAAYCADLGTHILCYEFDGSTWTQTTVPPPLNPGPPHTVATGTVKVQ